MKQRTLAGRQVSAIGLGAMPMSMNNDNQFPSHEDAVATVHAALDSGVTLIDTADIYAPAWNEMGHNERIVAEALRTWGGDSSGIFVATKGGITRNEGEAWGRDGSAMYLRQAVERSREILGVEVIDLYQYHRPDRWLVYGEVMATLATFQEEGLIRAVGISNASVEEIEIAQQVLGEGNLASVQNEFSPGIRAASTSCGTAASMASRSCRGARSAAPGAEDATSATASRPSARSASSTVSARSRSCSHGSWPWART